MRAWTPVGCGTTDTSILNSLRSFDPKQSHRNAFVTTIVERNVATIIRDRQAEKRDDRNVSSLNVTCRNGEFGPVELAQLIGQSEVDAQRGRQTRTHEQVVDLGNDVAENAFCGLPNDRPTWPRTG